MRLSEIAIGDLVQTFDNKIGVITDIGYKKLYLSTIDNDEKIYLKDIKKIRYIKPMCLKHHNRYCEICNQNK